ncbi:hypothetical protein BGY98DRAFT_963516, partial [Russula aff. rugulosa BPL654]
PPYLPIPNLLILPWLQDPRIDRGVSQCYRLPEHLLNLPPPQDLPIDRGACPLPDHMYPPLHHLLIDRGTPPYHGCPLPQHRRRSRYPIGCTHQRACLHMNPRHRFGRIVGSLLQPQLYQIHRRLRLGRRHRLIRGYQMNSRRNDSLAAASVESQ